MPRRKKAASKDAEPSAPLWMATFADMMTLLLCFFIMLLAFANFEDPGKIDAVMRQIKAAFSSGGHQNNDSPKTEPVGEVNKAKSNNDMDNSTQEALQTLVSSLRSNLAEMISQNLVRMTTTKTEIRVALDESILFRSGSSELHPAAYLMLGDIADALNGYAVTLVVEGHADADGTSEELNWQMSGRRSAAVVYELRQRVGIDGRPVIDGRYIEARGFGQFRPADVENRQSPWNRRVELVIRGRDTTAHAAIQNIEQSLGERNGGRY